jgi:hypothetical protein
MSSFKSNYDSTAVDYNDKYLSNERYPMSEIHKVYCHYNEELGRNVTAEEENNLKGDADNGKSSK